MCVCICGYILYIKYISKKKRQIKNTEKTTVLILV